MSRFESWCSNLYTFVFIGSAKGASVTLIQIVQDCPSRRGFVSEPQVKYVCILIEYAIIDDSIER